MKVNNVLVLNKNWVPVHIVDFKKAISQLFTDNAHALDLDFVSYIYEDWIKFSYSDKHFKSVYTTSYKVCVPEIIVLTKSDKLSSRDVKYTRENIMARDNFKCGYCGQVFPVKMLTKDHIIPKAQGGKDIWQNIITSCKTCNHKKGNRTPEQAGMPLLKHPTKPKWLNPCRKVHPTNFCKSWNKFLDKVDTTI